MKTLTHIVLAVCLILATGCGPSPQSGLVLYEQPPELAAQAHVKSRAGLKWYVVAPTGSMEPMITGGDTVVVDTTVPFTKKDLPDGSVCLYQPAADQRPYYPGLQDGVPVLHMLAAWSGDECIMDGIANKHYERGVLRMRKGTYIGKVVTVYTRRKAP